MKIASDTKGAPQERTRHAQLIQMAQLQTMSLPQLQRKWLDLYETEPPLCKKQYLIKRLSYRIQELYYGGLSNQTKNYLSAIAQADTHATKPSTDVAVKQSILPGTRLVRIWNHQRHEVTILEKGVEYQGKKYSSLSAVAREITKTQWNGKIFFGLKKTANTSG